MEEQKPPFDIAQEIGDFLKEIGNANHNLPIERPMPTVQSQRARKGHLVLLISLSAIVACVYIGVPLALFVQHFTRRSLVVEVAAAIALAALFGGVTMCLRVTTARSTQVYDLTATSIQDEMALGVGPSPRSCAEVMAAYPLQVPTTTIADEVPLGEGAPPLSIAALIAAYQLEATTDDRGWIPIDDPRTMQGSAVVS